MAETPRFSVPPTRRSVVAAAGGVGLAAALAACGSSDDSSNAASDNSSTSAAADPTTTDAGTAGGDTSPTTSAAAGGGTVLGKTSEIPVGGGKIYADKKVVVTQPTAGQYKAFSATCTHQGCLVTSVSDGTINCPCHSSKFHVADGSVAGGPAMAPLPPENVTVSGDEVMLSS